MASTRVRATDLLFQRIVVVSISLFSSAKTSGSVSAVHGPDSVLIFFVDLRCLVTAIGSPVRGLSLHIHAP